MKTLAAQLKKDLKAAFPSVKFSVTSDVDQLSVTYADGPGKTKVLEIANRYKDVDYDSNGEILSGGNTFVSVIRNLSPSAKVEFNDLLESKGYYRDESDSYCEKLIQLRNQADINLSGFVDQATFKL